MLMYFEMFETLQRWSVATNESISLVITWWNRFSRSTVIFGNDMLRVMHVRACTGVLLLFSATVWLFRAKHFPQAFVCNKFLYKFLWSEINWVTHSLSLSLRKVDQGPKLLDLLWILRYF